MVSGTTGARIRGGHPTGDPADRTTLTRRHTHSRHGEPSRGRSTGWRRWSPVGQGWGGISHAAHAVGNACGEADVGAVGGRGGVHVRRQMPCARGSPRSGCRSARASPTPVSLRVLMPSATQLRSRMPGTRAPCHARSEWPPEVAAVHGRRLRGDPPSLHPTGGGDNRLGGKRGVSEDRDGRALPRLRERVNAGWPAPPCAGVERHTRREQVCLPAAIERPRFRCGWGYAWLEGQCVANAGKGMRGAPTSRGSRSSVNGTGDGLRGASPRVTECQEDAWGSRPTHAHGRAVYRGTWPR